MARISPRFVLILALALPVSLASELACARTSAVTPAPVSPLTTVAKAVNDIATANSTITTTIIAANAQGLISNGDTQAILNICQQIAQADAQASLLIRGLSTLPAAQQTNVWAILKPVLATVNTSLQNGLLGVKDANTRATVSLALATLQAALTAVQAATGGQ